MTDEVTRPIMSVEMPDGRLAILTPANADIMDSLEAAGIEVERNSESELWAGNNWQEGNIVFAGGMPPNNSKSFRAPTLNTPVDFYNRAKWSREFYESEPLVYSLVNRDIDQAITNEEFQLPEDQELPKKALQRWRSTLNKSLGQHGGLSEYNRALTLDVVLSGLTYTLGNWGPMLVDGKVVQVPLNLVNFDCMSIVPDIDSVTGTRKYYYKLSGDQVRAIKNHRTNSPRTPGILQLIPDAKKRIVDDLEFAVKKLDSNLLGYSASWLSKNGAEGAWLELPLEDAYVINYRTKQADRWPTPSLVPIFPAIAMKRKLMLADWAVADGMVNMIVVWTFPKGVDANEGKSIVSKFVQGGRVQSHSFPEGTKVEVVTPPRDILNSSEKFWQPVSEIYAHFGYPLNSKSRGAGDLDSGPLDQGTNRARLDVLREVVTDHNTFFLKQIALRNEWDFDVYATLQSRDLDDDANFRTFASSLYDRGLLSIETIHDLANTSTEREAARRKREKEKGLETLFAIRPSFSQTVGTAQDGRPPASENRPRASGKGSDTTRGQSRSTRNRPSTTAKVTS